MTATLKEKITDARELVLSVLPSEMRREIERLARGHIGDFGTLREIRLRRGGVGALVLGDRTLPLSPISADSLAGIVARISDGCVFAHRDTICAGYISMGLGVRVGVYGSCRYEGGEVVGVGDISGLVFRLPTGKCEFGESLRRLYLEYRPRGMLIFSPPGVGKTTALRYLARALGTGPSRVNVVVVDERCEFIESDYLSSSVSLLHGYKKRLGIEIAVRTLSAGLVMVDELSADDVESISGLMRFGVPFIASIHASGVDEIMKKPSLSPLISTGAINMLVGISRLGGEYILSHELLD